MPFNYNAINYYEGDLNIKDVVAKAQLQDFDEALNVCDLNVLQEKYRIWRAKMPEVKPFYAVKCNDDAIILRELAKLGTNFDCASKNEIKQIIDMGISPERILFANPCRPVSHLEYAKMENITRGTVDNEFEIYKIHKHYPDFKLVVRFRCEAEQAQCPLGDKFGCDADSDAAALILLAKSLQMNVIGSSFHVGSGCNDLPAYNRAITVAKQLTRFGELLGNDMRLVDIGGGFPGSDDNKFAKIAKVINDSLERNFPNKMMEILAEPGRFFVAAAYTLICKIHAKREMRINGKLNTKMYYLNDGLYGSFNCILYDHMQITAHHLLDEKDDELPKFKSLIWGPTCDALDKILEELYLPDLRCDDLIAFPNMGAYSVPIASPFNGFMLPKTLYFKQRDAR